MKTMDFSYFIERYNAGEMSDSERQWFLKELDENEKLRNEVKLRKLTDEVLGKQQIISLRTKLSAIEKRRWADLYARRTLKPVYLKFAAVIAGVVLLGSVFLFTGRNLSSDDIINRYYKAYEFPTAQRSAQAGTNDDFSQALEFYNKHEYGKAALLFNKVLAGNSEDMPSEFLHGMANFEEKKYPVAEKSFNKVISDKDNYFIEDAQWYLALCYLKTDREKALKQFEVVRDEGSIYSKDAKKIIKNLK